MTKTGKLENQPLKKSKSMCSLTEDKVPYDVSVHKRDNFCSYRKTHSRTISDSSVEICVVNDTDSDEGGRGRLADSGIVDNPGLDGEMVSVLEQKIDRLSDMFLEQCRLLTTLKEDIRNSKSAMEKADIAQCEILSDLVKKAVVQNGLRELNAADAADSDPEPNSPARSLLNAIEVRQGGPVDREIREALASFLQSDELKEHMVAATAESVKGVIGDCLSRDVSALYLPVLEHSHRRLLRHINRTVEEAFVELEENSAGLSKSVFKISKSLKRAIERHQCLLEAAADPQKNLMTTLKFTVEELLQRELHQWRHKVLDIFSQLQAEPIEEPPSEPPIPPLEYTPTSPPQPADPDRSIIDQLMTAAEITKQIEDGDVNAAFERALSASDLAMVMAACRGAERAGAAPRGRLRPHVLLALLQQLSTDMLHNTQLKCRYLEDAIISLDPADAATRAHLPLVVGEVRRHLAHFLASYPSHVAHRRVALIIMAADNLLK